MNRIELQGTDGAGIRILAAGLAVPAVFAQATTMKPVRTGTIVDRNASQISVAQGMFGYDDVTLLAGLGFTAEMVFDTSRGTRSTTAISDRVTFQSDPPVSNERVVRSTKVTTSGVSFLFPVSEATDSLASVQLSGPDRQYTQSVSVSPTQTLTLRGVFGTDAPLDLESPVSLDEGTGPLGIFRFDVDQSTLTSAFLATETLTIAPVPLPATLPLALAGLGGLAVVARRGRRA